MDLQPSISMPHMVGVVPQMRFACGLGSLERHLFQFVLPLYRIPNAGPDMSLAGGIRVPASFVTDDRIRRRCLRRIS